MKTGVTVLVIFISIYLLFIPCLSTSQDESAIPAEAPHCASEIIIEPNPELEGTFKCSVKLTILETGEVISGPELILVKGMDGTAGTAHDWVHLDTFLKASSDKEGKSVHYSLDLFFKGARIGNNSGKITTK